MKLELLQIQEDLKHNVASTAEYASTEVVEADDMFVVDGVENRIIDEKYHPSCGIYALVIEDAQGRQAVVPPEDIRFDGFEEDIDMNSPKGKGDRIMKEIVQFDIIDVETYVKRGDYTRLHEEWLKWNPEKPKLNYDEYLEEILIPEWEKLGAFGYSNGVLYGNEDGYDVALDYRNFDEEDWDDDISQWDCIRVVK